MVVFVAAAAIGDKNGCCGAVIMVTTISNTMSKSERSPLSKCAKSSSRKNCKTALAPRIFRVSRSWRWVYCGGVTSAEVAKALVHGIKGSMVCRRAARRPPPGVMAQFSSSENEVASRRWRWVYGFRASRRGLMSVRGGCCL